VVLLCRKPSLGARSSVQNGAANDRPWRAYSERLPSVESARIPPQFGGEFFLRQKIFKNRLRERHGDLRSVVSRAEDDMQMDGIKGLRATSINPYSNGEAFEL
jgi:hypothetical protein